MGGQKEQERASVWREEVFEEQLGTSCTGLNSIPETHACLVTVFVILFGKQVSVDVTRLN